MGALGPTLERSGSANAAKFRTAEKEGDFASASCGDVVMFQCSMRGERWGEGVLAHQIGDEHRLQAYGASSCNPQKHHLTLWPRWLPDGSTSR